MTTISGTNSALASDVVCVIGPNGIYSTDFHVRFSLPSFNPSSLDGLYQDDHDDNDEDKMPSNHNSNTIDSIHSDPMNRDTEPSETNGHYNHKRNHEEERLQLLKLGPEWVDVYCNGILCKEISAVVGINEQLFFVEEKKLSLVPSEKILLSMNLDRGLNQMKCIHRNTNQTVSFELWLFESSDSLIVTDIDGTITISDVRGYLETVYLGYYSYIHDGIIAFLDYLSSRYGYRIIYLTSRPITHKTETRNLLLNAKDGSLSLPRGPLFTNRASTLDAAYGELIAKTAKIQKSNELLKIVDVFTAAGRDKRLCPIALGLGNRLSDALAYNSAGLAPQNIILIDQTSTIRIWEAPVLVPTVKSITNDSSEYSSVVSSNNSSSNSSSNSNSNSGENSPVATPMTMISLGHGSSKSNSNGNGNSSSNKEISKLILVRTSSAPVVPTTSIVASTTEGQITSYVDDDGVSRSAIFSTYRDGNLWKYTDLLASHHRKREDEIQRLIYEELRVTEALEAAREAGGILKALREASDSM